MGQHALLTQAKLTMEDQIGPLIIFSLFKGKNRWLALVLMQCYPKLYSQMEKVYAILYRKVYPERYHIVIQKYNGDDHNTSNFCYVALNWYCCMHYMKEQTSLVSKTHITRYQDHMRDCDGCDRQMIPDYLPVSTIDVMHKGSPIKVTFDIEGERITLEGSSLASLNEFVLEATNMHTKYRYGTIDINEIYVCRWKKDCYEPSIMNTYKTYDNVYLPPKLLNGITFDISQFKASEGAYMKDGIPYKRGYLFYGSPGTGKTSTVYAIARENRMNMYKVNCKTAGDARFKEQMKSIPKNSVVLIEEVDTQINDDRSGSYSDKVEIFGENLEKSLREEKVNLSVLMEILDGYDYLYGCIIILTTNHKDCLDKALIRPGRVDMHYHFEEMGSVDIRETIRRFSGVEVNVSDDVIMSSSTLINQILLPNRNDQEAIQRLLNEYSEKTTEESDTDTIDNIVKFKTESKIPEKEKPRFSHSGRSGRALERI